MRIFHIATVEDWAAARESGSYATSTRGRTLAEEGFIHAARRDQVAGVWRRYYAGLREPLVLLTIETDRLDVPWQEDAVGEDTYPHLYGALSPRAVVAVEPLDRRGGTPSFTQLFFGEMVRRVLVAVAVMLVAAVASRVGASLDPTWGAFVGALVGLVLGTVVAVAVLRRRR